VDSSAASNASTDVYCSLLTGYASADYDSTQYGAKAEVGKDFSALDLSIGGQVA
jgi:hypothetical protein